MHKAGMVVRACNPSKQEVEEAGLKCKGIREAYVLMCFTVRSRQDRQESSLGTQTFCCYSFKKTRAASTPTRTALMPSVAGWWDRNVLRMTLQARRASPATQEWKLETAVKGEQKDSEAARQLGQGSRQSEAPALPPVELRSSCSCRNTKCVSAESPSDATTPS